MPLGDDGIDVLRTDAHCRRPSAARALRARSAAGAVFSSTNEFHAPQSGQRPEPLRRLRAAWLADEDGLGWLHDQVRSSKFEVRTSKLGSGPASHLLIAATSCQTSNPFSREVSASPATIVRTLHEACQATRRSASHRPSGPAMPAPRLARTSRKHKAAQTSQRCSRQSLDRAEGSPGNVVLAHDSCWQPTWLQRRLLDPLIEEADELDRHPDSRPPQVEPPKQSSDVPQSVRRRVAATHSSLSFRSKFELRTSNLNSVA